ncbi:hypothetical protein CQ047_16895 [Microbacterium sp. MYb72]|uniref:hypothetical protein n=1 Tax=Microbacterium sp. MYb72 TaxID=1848693 RepID=UPI000CFC7841|nr:hypothetical protein [Microbacterium sp. MYb72]PRB04239.1 hypothetical protein CQ047_16895 [Microbacterium sp. MYb72]
MRLIERTPAIERGRRRKAEQFAAAARMVEELEDDDELVDVIVTLCVHSGIASSDVICLKRLGTHVKGENHAEAVSHLKKADDGASSALATLLSMKTKAGYGFDSVSRSDLTRAMRAMESLVTKMRAS